MFTKLAKPKLTRLWPVQSPRVALGLPTVALSDAAHSNDNLPGFHRAVATGKRRSPSPALTCRWSDRNGRLECRWQIEIDAPIADVGILSGDLRVSFWLSAGEGLMRRSSR